MNPIASFWHEYPGQVPDPPKPKTVEQLQSDVDWLMGAVCFLLVILAATSASK